MKRSEGIIGVSKQERAFTNEGGPRYVGGLEISILGCTWFPNPTKGTPEETACGFGLLESDLLTGDGIRGDFRMGNKMRNVFFYPVFFII